MNIFTRFRVLSTFIFLAAAVVACLVVVTCAGAVGLNEVAQVDANGTAPANATDDSEARDRLMGMASYLAAAPAFSVTIRSGYDAVQEDGQRIEFGEKRRFTLQRPDKIRVDVQRSDGDNGLFIYDGKAFTVFKAEDNIFARMEKNGTVDEMIVYMVRDLNMVLPLSRMFLSRFPQSLEKLITSASLVEENFLFDVPTDHLAARSKEVDLQIWVAKGDAPLPRRVVITYKTSPGVPQFWAELSDWNLSPKISGDTFSFTPPAGAEQIPLLAPAKQKRSVPTQEGGVQ